VGIISLSVLRSKSSSNPEATPTIPSVASLAVRLGKQSVTAATTVTMALESKCSRLFVLNVAQTQKFPSNPAAIGRFTVAIAIAKYDLIDRLVL